MVVYNFMVSLGLRSALRARSRMSRATAQVLRICLILLSMVAACLLFPRRATEAEETQGGAEADLLAQAQTPKASAAKPQPTGKPAGARAFKRPLRPPFNRSATSGRPTTSRRNMSRRSPSSRRSSHPATPSPQTISTSASRSCRPASTTETLASLTTAKQMDPNLVPVDYNLGIPLQTRVAISDGGKPRCGA